MDAPADFSPEHYNHDLLRAIPPAARTVLEVGCGPGALALAYRARNPRVRFLGIELDPERAAMARTRLDRVASVDVERTPLPFDPGPGFDCIVYGDVLEHLHDPLALLATHAKALAPDGTMVISVPNLEHWSFAARLLRGTWHYEEDGLFDRGHLRWFTRATMAEALAKLGLHPCDYRPRIFDAEAASRFTETIAPALAALGVDAVEYRERASPLQYVWRAKKAPPERMLIGAAMLEPVGGVSHVRIVYPMAALESDARVVTRLYAEGELLEPPDPDIPHIFILHRSSLLGSEGRAMLRMVLAQGWVIVNDFDDHPDFFEAMRRPDQIAFCGVHAISTTTPVLAEVLRGRHPEVGVFQNAVPALRPVRNFTRPDRITLFFGALNREDDWRPLIGALNNVARLAGPRLHFRIVHDRALFDALETPHKEFTPVCDHETYLDLLGGAEISFMPLADTAFNRTKSDLKHLEAASCRVLSLASTTVYAGSIVDGRTGLLFADAEELQQRLARIVAMPDMARGLADAARAQVAAERMQGYQVAARLAWYRDLWTRRGELTAALLERMAKLAEAGVPDSDPANPPQPGRSMPDFPVAMPQATAPLGTT